MEHSQMIHVWKSSIMFELWNLLNFSRRYEENRVNLSIVEKSKTWFLYFHQFLGEDTFVKKSLTPNSNHLLPCVDDGVNVFSPVTCRCSPIWSYKVIRIIAICIATNSLHIVDVKDWGYDMEISNPVTV